MGLSFTEGGAPCVDLSRCSGCGMCCAVCPGQVLVRGAQGKAAAAGGNFFGCIGCGHCMAVCPAGAVRVAASRLEPGAELADLPEAAHAEQLSALFARRRSVRLFRDQEIERGTLERILKMTAAAPMGLPPHEVGVLVVHGRDRVRCFADEAVRSFVRVRRKIPWLRLALWPFMRPADRAALREFVIPLVDLIEQEHDKGQDAFAYGGAALLLFHSTPCADPADSHIAATYAMLAAESLGLGACLLGTAIMFNYDRAFKARYGLPQENKIGLGVTIGWPRVRFARALHRAFRDVRWI